MSNFFDDRYWRDLPRKEDCPEVAEDGRSFKSNYTSILDNRFGYIVGDIMRDFLPQYLSWTDPNGINDRITWWDGRKRNSDKNFAYYASCMYSSTVSNSSFCTHVLFYGFRAACGYELTVVYM